MTSKAAREIAGKLSDELDLYGEGMCAGVMFSAALVPPLEPSFAM